MSEYTREEIPELIEENGGPEGLGFVAGKRIRRSQDYKAGGLPRLQLGVRLGAFEL